MPAVEERRGSALRARAAAWAPTVPWWAPVLFVVAVFAVVGWSTLMQVGPRGGYDSPALQAYAELFDSEGRLPREEENYEYWLPPGLPVAAVGIKRLTQALPLPPEPAVSVPGAVRGLAWLALTGLALGLLATPSRRRQGAVVAVLALLWAAVHVLWSVKTVAWNVYPEVSWLGYPLMSLVACAGLVAATGLVAHEVWPSSRSAPALASVAIALLPVVPRMGLFFHPDPWLALFTAVALWLVLRAARSSWPPWTGFAAGAVMATAALVRPSSAVVMAALGLAVVLLGRRRAAAFTVVAALAIAAIAGPWWVVQTYRTGNPLKSNLERPGYMIDRQPRSFYVSFPIRDFVLHPYRPRFQNELLPRFHAELWADWGANLFDRDRPTALQRITASTQSVLGLGGDALVLGGFLLFGVPACRRALRRDAARGDAGPVVATTLFAVTWVAFVATLIRYPQGEGDPIKSSYLLFLAPACAVMGLATARRLWRRAGWPRLLLATWLALYAVSYALVFAGAGLPDRVGT